MKPVLLLLLAVAACGPTGNSPDAVCARRVYQDPDVKLLMEKQAGNAALSNTTQPRLDQLKAEARQRCLQSLHAAPPGGVEAHHATYGDVTPW